MGLMKKLTSAIVASSLVLSAAGTVLAAPSADEQSASYARMEALKLVVGTDRGAELEGELTRAQLLTIIVRAFDKEEAAKWLSDRSSFSDVPGGQWYSGYVAVAKNLATERGFAIGYPDGTFQPNKQVSVIEALAMIMKFLGVPVGTGDNWVAQTIENAKAAGVITDADVEKFLSDPNAAATRGVAIALADQIFYNYKLVGDKTVYTYYVDNQAPVISVDPIGTPTVDAAEVTIKGKIEGADKAFVTPQGGEAQEITVDANGNFSVAVPLVAGENSIVISATDIAGNYSEYVVRVNRVAGAAAEIQVASTEITVPAGSEFELGYKVVDATGLELAEATAAVKVTVEGEIGTVDGGVLIASEKVGTGTITLSYEGLEDVVINVKIVPAELAGVKIETESAAPGEAVKLIAVDAYGNPIEAEDVVFSTDEEKAFVKGDIFTATEPGVYKVTATQGEKSVTSEIKVYGEADELVIDVPANMVRNGKTEYTVVVKVVDKNGALVRDFDGEILLTGDFDQEELSAKAKNGVATFEKITVSTSKVAFAAEAVDTDLDIAEIEVETVKPVATGLKLSSDTPFYGLGERAVEPTVKLYVVDQAGAEIEYDEDEPIVIRISGPATFEGVRSDEILTVSKSGEELKITHRDGETEGDITITATSDELKEASLTLKAVQVGSPRNLVVTKLNTFDKTEVPAGYALYRIGLTDRNGAPVYPSDDYEVTLTFNHDDVTVYWNYDGGTKPADFENGPITPDSKNKVTGITFNGDVPVKDASRYVYVLLQANEGKAVSFTASSPRMTSASVDVEFKADKAAKLAHDKVITLGDGETKTVEFQVTDKYGAPVKEVVEIKLVASDKLRMNGKRDELKIKTDGNGKASVRITPDLMGSDAKITVTVDADEWDYTGYITVIRATNDAARLVVSAKVGDKELKKGGEVDASVSGNVEITVEARTRAGSKPISDHFDVPEFTVMRGTEDVRHLFNFGQAVKDGEKVGGTYVLTPKGALDEGTYEITFVDTKSSQQPEATFSFTVVKNPTGLKALPPTATLDKANTDAKAQFTVTLDENAPKDTEVKIFVAGAVSSIDVDETATIAKGTKSTTVEVTLTGSAKHGDVAYVTFFVEGVGTDTVTINIVDTTWPSMSVSAPDVKATVGEEFTMPVTAKGAFSDYYADHKVRFYAVISGLTQDDIELTPIPGAGKPAVVTDDDERGYAGAEDDDLVLAWGPAGGFPLGSHDYAKGVTTEFKAKIMKEGEYEVRFVFYNLTREGQLNSDNDTATITVTAAE